MPWEGTVRLADHLRKKRRSRSTNKQRDVSSWASPCVAESQAGEEETVGRKEPEEWGEQRFASPSEVGFKSNSSP